MASDSLLKKRLTIAALTGAAALAIFVIGYHCPFKAATGIDCPACGMTRALTSLAQGNLQTSLYWHPMLIPTMLLGGMALLFRTRRRVVLSLVWIWIALMGACWIWRVLF